MQKLIDGIHRFEHDDFGEYKELFHRLSVEGQNPHTLFITCSDSRVLAELITHSRPGDLFVVKNVGNIIPPSGVEGETNSTAAAVEYAIAELNVEDVVVCAHSQCGAMKALLDPPENLEDLPHLFEWLKLAKPVKETIHRHYTHISSLEDRINAAAEENALYALQNLQTYPCVKQRLKEGTLRLHAWYFKIATAQLYSYRPESAQYELLSSDRAQLK